MSFEFLSPIAEEGPDGPSPLARSPMEPCSIAAGASLETRDGWSVAAHYGSVEHETETCRATVGWADCSHLGKLELHAGAADLARLVAGGSAGSWLEQGRAVRAAGAWWCRLTAERALVICEPSRADPLRRRLETAATTAQGPTSVIDVSTAHAALVIAGPLAREAIARFCALDLRAAATPVGGFRPGSVARTPGYVLHEDPDRFLVLFGWALGEYMWTVVADAATNLGGAPVGLDALAPLPEPAIEEAASHA